MRIIPRTFDESFEQVKELATRFQRSEKQYLSPSYSEAQARLDFIDKFWIALGWDVGHDLQTNPYEQEVKVERGVQVRAARKRADYAFLAPNFRDVRFYVEAKKPHTELDTADKYFQVIRYGWNSQTPLAVLTDFEQLRVLDCRYKPDIETALRRVVKKFHYAEYADAEKFKEIYYLFSREAVNNGSLEKFAATLPRPTGKAVQRTLFGGGYQSIDESFLQELDGYREELARSFKNKNPHFNSEELTEVTQRTIDRLVFMRFLEDKLIEPEPIVERLGTKGTAWQDFVASSRRLDSIYNGIIFKRHDLLDATDFQVDGRVFDGIREDLAHTNSPYDFNAIPIHILGSIYERFLGKVIIATDKRARIEDKPEVRKAGGVYYTPEYIVTYIVENTVGKLIEGKTPEQIAEMRFADIACGSGSFLLGVYDYLLRYHTAYYNEKNNRVKAVRAGCLEYEDGTLHLSLKQKRRILLNNIYGVDLDPQAVEVAQLSLFLKLLEEETTATAKNHQLEFRETMLPSLDKNIIHGNSLIGWDILEGRLFDREEERKLHPLNFAQAFPDVMKRGGFDAIVGNPPYVFGGNYGISDVEKDYFKQRYISGTGKVNLFTLLIERALQLLRNGGLQSYIIPNTLLRVTSYAPSRKFILEETAVERIVDLGTGVFKGATTSSIILVLRKQKGSLDNQVVIQTAFKSPERFTQQKAFYKGSYIFGLYSDLNEMQLLERIKSASIALGSLCEELIFGVVITKNRDQVVSIEKKQGYKPFLEGKDISRYYIHPTEKYLNYNVKLLHRPRTPRIFEAPEKLLIQRITGGKRPLNVAYDNQQHYNKESINNLLLKEEVQYSIKYILGLLNSKLMNWIYLKEFTNESTLTVNLSKEYLSQLPIRTINFSDKADKAQHDKIVNLVEQILQAKQQLATARSDRDKTFYENKSAALDQQLDALIYELYGLTNEEIALVEV